MLKTVKDKIPVTVLTGFLGSGKTTLLNYILKENHGMKIAVIENEFGEIGIDGDLVVGSTEEIFEMTNGCVCCVAEARDDLLRVIRQLLARPERLDHIIIETSGLADPYPVAQTFFLDDPIRNETNLDGVITLVDVKHIRQHLDDIHLDGIDNQAVDQIVCADRIVLNKVDLAQDADIADVSRRIRQLNETADIVLSSYAQIDLTKILGLAAFDRNRKMAAEIDFDWHVHNHNHHSDGHGDGHVHDHEDHGHEHAWLGDASHTHDTSVTSVGIEFPGNMDPQKISRWVQELKRQNNENLFRMKGIFSVQDDDYCYVLHGVHNEIEFRPNHPWAGDERSNKMIFIGRNLDRASLQARIEACRA
ncbi:MULTISPECIES: CobW family GTP-binding protein [Brucella]|uniref:Cobalamin synthesis cobW C-terminal domain protein n=1 Tax=Brucella lupini TaxID=255457 RepID=A0A256GHH6_9HYPH|nr:MULTISPECIES: GTP-binding protein [Brucella]RNL47807.1 GTP-binding protein [Ochrobactrum sp. MH181795]KAB2703014.1 GTP-binding protein [Brucella lupini]KAB2724433.1 GTP-binding protein [Brucella anthropi]KAB2736497.1 GTP-binding protein [Brucella anthropi]KAB2792138.1 GTP-binding protein [Brucella anthropi]